MIRIKAQVAPEYILVLGFVLIVTVPILYYAMRESNVNIKINQISDAVNTLARAADTVYSIGPGTRKYVWVNIPGGVESYSLDNKSVLFKLSIFGGVSDVFEETKADLAGVIPISKGQHRVLVEMLESGYVHFGEADDNQAPIVTWTSPHGTINYQGIVLRANTNEYSACRFDVNDVSYFSMSEPFVGSALTHERDMGILAIGNYTYYARCQDPSGNVMDESAIINFTIVPPLGENGSGTEAYEPNPPIVHLISPPNWYFDNDSIMLFEYNVTDESSISFCQLIIGSIIDQYEFNITKNTTQNFNKTGINYGNHSWNVNCTDTHGNRNSSEIWNFTTNSTPDMDSPIVRLIAPDNNTVRNYWLTKFSYNVSDLSSEITHCNLHMFGLLDGGGTVDWSIRDSPVQENTIESVSLPLFKANYTWNVSCVDDSYYANEGYSETWHLVINITAGEEAFLDSCSGVCGYNGYSDGVCQNNIAKCSTYCPDCYMPDGNQFCTGGPETDTCCCIP